MTEQEQFPFDLRGYVVIDKVLTPEEVGAGNAAVDHHLDLVQKREPGLAQAANTWLPQRSRGVAPESAQSRATVV